MLGTRRRRRAHGRRQARDRQHLQRAGDTNLNAIAAAVIGGTSLLGGRGSAYSALLGIIVIAGIASATDPAEPGRIRAIHITGAVLFIAVAVDSAGPCRSRQAHGADRTLC